MILATSTSVAIQCSRCGELEFHTLSLFAFAGQEKVKRICHCGEPLISVTGRNRKQFNLSFRCAFCAQTHYLRLKRKTIWGHEVLPLICPEMEATVGFIGPKQKVAQACRERQRLVGDLTTELGYEEEFENPEVMLRVLDHLHALAKQGFLGCGCGNRYLTFELLPDRIELYCELCEALGIIHADHPESVLMVEGMTSIILEENKTCQINRQQWTPKLEKKIEED